MRRQAQPGALPIGIEPNCHGDKLGCVRFRGGIDQQLRESVVGKIDDKERNESNEARRAAITIVLRLIGWPAAIAFIPFTFILVGMGGSDALLPLVVCGIIVVVVTAAAGLPLDGLPI